MKRTGSLSPSSSETQATYPSLPARSLNHSTSKVVLPKPAGAEIKVSLRPGSRSRVAVSRGRATRFGRARENRSLVDTSESGAGLILAHLLHLILLNLCYLTLSEVHTFDPSQ